MANIAILSRISTTEKKLSYGSIYSKLNLIRIPNRAQTIPLASEENPKKESSSILEVNELHYRLSLTNNVAIQQETLHPSPRPLYDAKRYQNTNEAVSGKQYYSFLRRDNIVDEIILVMKFIYMLLRQKPLEKSCRLYINFSF